MAAHLLHCLWMDFLLFRGTAQIFRIFLGIMLIVTALISHCLMRDTDAQRGWVT